MKDHYIFYCEGRHDGKSFGMGKLMGEVPWRPHVLSLVSASDNHEKGRRHAWHGSSQGAAQEMCEIQRGKWRKLSRNGVCVAFGGLSSQ